MALTRFFFGTCLLLLLSLSIASAADYVNTQVPVPNKPINQDVPLNNNIPKPELDQLNKPKDFTDHVPKTDLSVPNKPKDLSNNVPKPDLDRLKPEGYGGGVVPKQGLGNPKLLDTERLLPLCIEGLVLCKSGQKVTPIKGAKARITCIGDDENGYETTQSRLSPATDEKGYFFATLPVSISKLGNYSKLTDCKAKVDNPPLENCKVPTDINNGMSGAPLDTYRILKHKNIKLYRLRPFVFTPEPEPEPEPKPQPELSCVFSFLKL